MRGSRRVRRLGVVAAVVAALGRRRSLGVGGAAARRKLTKVTLQLKWVPQAQFAGYYAAQEKGYYKKRRAST